MTMTAFFQTCKWNMAVGPAKLPVTTTKRLAKHHLNLVWFTAEKTFQLQVMEHTDIPALQIRYLQVQGFIYILVFSKFEIQLSQKKKQEKKKKERKWREEEEEEKKRKKRRMRK